MTSTARTAWRAAALVSFALLACGRSKPIGMDASVTDGAHDIGATDRPGVAGDDARDGVDDPPSEREVADADAPHEVVDAPVEPVADAPVEPVANARPGPDADVSTPLEACVSWWVADERYWARCEGRLPVWDAAKARRAPWACPRIAASVAAGRSTFDGARILECVRTLEDAACRDRLLPSCAGAFRPLVPSGGACNPLIENECVGATYCRAADAGSCGGTCVPTVAFGERCDTRAACGPGADCQGGTCYRVRVLARGEPCFNRPECGPASDGGTVDCSNTLFRCEPGSFCGEGLPDAGPSGICIPGSTSAACLHDSACAAGYQCRGALPGLNFNGHCAPLLRLGETCPGSMPCGMGFSCERCISGSVCEANKCVAPPEASLPCGSEPFKGTTFCKPGEQCNGGLCQPTTQSGEACEP